MKYVALLRAINVGGNSKVNMQELKQLFEQAGMRDVRTYINSGNVIFTSDLAKDKLAQVIGQALKKAYSWEIPVILVDEATIHALVKALPDTWVNDATMKCDIMFLNDSANKPEVLNELKIKPDIDNVIYAPGAVLWSVDRQFVTRSGLLKIIGTDLYKQMTIRNCNTLRKLAVLLGE